MNVGKYVLFPLLLAALLSGAALTPVAAQDTPVITLAVPEFMEDLFSDEALAPFEAEQGVDVQIVTSLPFFGPASSGLDTYLEDIQEYVSSADVVFSTGNTLSTEATRAGLYLDLAPLVNGDPALNAADFVPAIWQSVQWDNGVWAIPFSADVTVLTYDPAAFDRAGLAYPSEGWTMDDLANAARALATVGSDGTVSLPGLAVVPDDLDALFRSLSPEGFYDPATFPNAPRLATPTLESLLTQWNELVSEGVVTTSFSGDEYQQIPMRIEGSFGMGGMFGDEPERGGTLLPGGHAGLSVNAFAVSSGTLHPDQSYALARWLSNNAILAQSFFGRIPARQSLVGVQPQAEDVPQFVGPPQSEAAQAVLNLALANAIPLSETRFGDYMARAADHMTSEGLDALGALQQEEANAIANLQAAEQFRAETTIAVATPVPPPVLAPGEVAINFGMASFVMPFPNQDEWDRVIADFVAADPQVGQVVFDTARGNPAELTENYDCFYLPYNAVPSIDLSAILNLDPYIDTDPTFSRTDVVGNALSQLQRDNMTWALPLIIQPQVIRYDPARFAAAGVPEPQGGWTIDSFVDALEALKTQTGDDAPFNAMDFGGSYILMLVAAYGGLPLDYRTNPPTVNFTDPANLTAVQQVLDLAKNGYINYEELSGFGNRMIIATGGEEPPIYTQLLDGAGIEIRRGGENRPVYEMTGFPSGSQYNAVSYNIGTGYISAAAQNPDACYRWLSEISRHPELFDAMPARRSLIQDPSLAAAQGADAAALYAQIDSLLQQPNTLVFPTPFGEDVGASLSFAMRFWMNRAFDNYVLHDADLAAELEQAQTYITAFQGCMANVPPFDAATQDRREYMQTMIECGVQVDPSLSELMNMPQGG